MKIATASALSVTLIFSVFVFGQTESQVLESDPYGERLGTVHFPVSCEEAAKAQAERGLALLHHMTYEGARAAFEAAAKRDADCAMAYWGQAMTYIHPLWSDPPSEVEFERGKALVEKAKSVGQKADWEEDYIAVVEGYYVPGWSRQEQPNLTNFEMGWGMLHERYPDDPEAAAFFALGHLANADPSDKSYTRQEHAAKIARQVLAMEPNHPGAHHYIIHAYDYPPLAEKALDVARSYSDIAPEVPHALHMASHIFTRLGQWEESIEMNQRSAEAALREAESEEKEIPFHYLHAIDYLVYAHLQRADKEQAQQRAEAAANRQQAFEHHLASAYALASVPARIALETRNWEQAASLEARAPTEYPWDQAPAAEAITHFARALGAARAGKPQLAQQALDKLSELQTQLEDDPYWAKQVEIQRLAAQAWLDYQQAKEQTQQQGNQATQQAALDTMRKAAELEASTEKHPVTPGEVLPARELLADMLLDMGRYQEAQTAYQAALERSPKRFNSLYGLGRAAELAGNQNEATRYYQQLVEISAPNAERERLAHAEQYLAIHASL